MGHVRLGFVVGVGLFAALVAPAKGQLVGLKRIWTIPGVMNNPGVVTVFICTSNNNANETIGVEVYDSVGGFVTDGSITTALLS